MTCGSLFAGIGGFDLGFERAGIKTIWQVEIDEYCRRVLARHFPDAERFGDIRECGAHNLKPVDVICGGFPCQDISTAGRGAGIDGERSGLWREMHRIISELRPKYAVVENVAALLDRGIGRVFGDLAEVGYDAQWSVLTACRMGAPHMRTRVFIVAYPHGDRLQAGSLAEFGATEGIHESSSGSVAGRGECDWSREWREGPDGTRIRRMAYGVPNRVDRLSSIGNAIVPQIAEWIGRRILEVANG